MLKKFSLTFFICFLVQKSVLTPSDIYPSNLPAMFWMMRDHFYERLSAPSATRASFASTLCEFVRLCDFISPNPVGRDRLRSDLNDYSVIRKMTETAKADNLSVLDELEKKAKEASLDFYSSRPIPGYVFTKADGAPNEAAEIYPKAISSFFWVAREQFYCYLTDEESTKEDIRKSFCELILISDHVAPEKFIKTCLRVDLEKFSFEKKIKRKRKTEILSILSELEQINVYETRPIPGYNLIKSPDQVAQEQAIILKVFEYTFKQQSLITDAKSYMGNAFKGLLMPEEIAEILKEYIRGQDSAMNALGIIGHKIMAQIRLKQTHSDWEFRPPHAFLIGKSGSGKTQSVIELCKIIGIPWIRINAPEVVGEGFKGPTLSYHYEQLKQAQKIPPYAIIILDEAGKMGRTGSGDDAPKYGSSIMRTLLAHMDGTTVKLPSSDSSEQSLSTKCFTYLATDACATLPDSVEVTPDVLGQYIDMPLELINRFSQGIIRLAPHTVSSLFDILKNNSKGAYAHERNFFKKLYNIDLVIEDEGLKAIAERSILDSTGVRKLEEILGHVISPLYSLPIGLIKEENGTKKITLDKKFVQERLPAVVQKEHNPMYN